MTIEAFVVQALAAALAVPAYAEVPSDRPTAFVTVERLGGPRTEYGLIDHPRLAVQSWAATTAEAARLADEVDRAMHDAVLSGPVRRVDTDSIYNHPAEGPHKRYQGVYDLVAKTYE